MTQTELGPQRPAQLGSRGRGLGGVVTPDADPGSDAPWAGGRGGRAVGGRGWRPRPVLGVCVARRRKVWAPAERGEPGGRAAALGMGKEQELLEAARTGHLPAVEKLLSGKRLSSGFGGGGGSSSGGGGGGSGGSGGGLGSSSHPLSSLLR